MRKIIGVALMMLLAISISSNADAGSTSGLITKMMLMLPIKSMGIKRELSCLEQME
ncbi:hypothetical protein [Candidatus Electronema sp. PJ]|uniref:hypothetical protein n=1 Tax=Candidatus Electronema sp. PJ TaxID=3401572 RepID=UPI003AA9701E